MISMRGHTPSWWPIDLSVCWAWSDMKGGAWGGVYRGWCWGGWGLYHLVVGRDRGGWWGGSWAPSVTLVGCRWGC